MGRGDRAAGTSRGNRGEARWAVPSPRPGRAPLLLWGWVQLSAPASHLTILPRPGVPTLAAHPAPSFPPGQRRAGGSAVVKAAVLHRPGAVCIDVRFHCILICPEYSLEGVMLMGRQWKQCQTLFFGAPKSLEMVIAAVKLKDAYSLEGKL